VAPHAIKGGSSLTMRGLTMLLAGLLALSLAAEAQKPT
jgi:hypothetical protein